MFDFSGPPPLILQERPAIVLPGDAEFITPMQAAILPLVRKRKAAAAVHSAAFLGTAVSAGISTSQNMTLDLGTANAGDKIVIWTSGERGGGSPPGSFTGCTIDGQTGVNIAAAEVQGFNEVSGFWYFDDVSGLVSGSSTITVTGAKSLGFIIAGWRLKGSATGTPAVANIDVLADGADPNDTNVDIAANGIVLSGFIATFDRTPVAWANIDEDFEAHTATHGGLTYTGASRKYISSASNQLIRCDAPGPTFSAMSTVAFSPA